MEEPAEETTTRKKQSPRLHGNQSKVSFDPTRSFDMTKKPDVAFADVSEESCSTPQNADLDLVISSIEMKA